MKTLLISFLLLVSFGSFAQQEYHYQIKLDGVIDLVTAKPIKDPLRAKFLCYTVYDEVALQFDFMSTVNIDQTDLQLYLSDYGYTIVQFVKNSSVIEEEKE